MVICIGTIDENKKEIILAWNTNRYATEAEMLGARTIMPSITTEKRLLNVVEEIALASGISPPNVYILDDDAAINALTVGDVPQKTAIVITSGALRYLNRDELQAVIAHEFSHISSDDIKLSILASSLIILSSLIALFSGALYGFHHFLIPMPFSIFGLTILILTSKSKDVANKQRVFGADASSMHFCGHNGIAGALKKIGGLNSIVKARYASKFSYYFFAEGAESILSTHPSLAERIKRIDPNWNGEFITPKALIDEDDTIANDDDHNKAATVAAVAIVAIQNALSNATDPLTCAKADIAAIPEYLRDQAANPLTARWVIYALLVDRRDQNIAVKQREIIAANVYLEGSKKIESAIDSFKREGIVHLIFLCMSALKKLTKKQYAHFREVADLLIEEDGKVSLFEFNLKYLVFYPLDIAFDLRKPPKIVYNAIEPIAKEISIALSAIVYDQYQNDEKAKSAFDN
ncbi:MAG: M48 family metalloprotease, partial [Helicobacteraceae bacterium]|nr:M48 family metalloprotease [Helicobacteraceae bacterium]